MHPQLLSNLKLCLSHSAMPILFYVCKLEVFLADALDKKCDTIFTCGGIQSNHCRSTAVAARQLGLDCYLFLRSPEQASI